MNKIYDYIIYLNFVKYQPGTKIEPGDALQMNDGEVLLVGDVNEVFGICDDCHNYTRHDINSIAKNVMSQLLKY